MFLSCVELELNNCAAVAFGSGQSVSEIWISFIAKNLCVIENVTLDESYGKTMWI